MAIDFTKLSFLGQFFVYWIEEVKTYLGGRSAGSSATQQLCQTDHLWGSRGRSAGSSARLTNHRVGGSSAGSSATQQFCQTDQPWGWG